MDGDVIIAPPYGISDVSGENEEHVKEVKERVGFCEEDKGLVIKYEVVLTYLLKQSLCNECNSQTTILLDALRLSTWIPHESDPIGRLAP